MLRAGPGSEPALGSCLERRGRHGPHPLDPRHQPGLVHGRLRRHCRRFLSPDGIGPARATWPSAVTDGAGFLLRRAERHQARLSNVRSTVCRFIECSTRAKAGRYRLEKEVLAHPRQDAILQRTRFDADRGRSRRISRVHAADPHLGKPGGDIRLARRNTRGVPMLFARSRGDAWPWHARRRGPRARPVS